jgi:hypothetical protein
MPSKPNYNHQRAERDRAKQAKKEEKLMSKKEAAQRRASAPEGETQDGPAEGGAE